MLLLLLLMMMMMMMITIMVMVGRGNTSGRHAEAAEGARGCSAETEGMLGGAPWGLARFCGLSAGKLQYAQPSAFPPPPSPFPNFLYCRYFLRRGVGELCLVKVG